MTEHDLLDWLKKYWRQDTRKLKYLNWCEGRVWPDGPLRSYHFAVMDTNY